MLTAEHVKALWAYMQHYYGTQVVSKAAALEMQVVADTLGLLGILDKDAFLTRFTTTIGKAIYVPFEVGVESAGHTLLSQVIVCAHEHQHVVQLREHGVTFLLNYLLNSSSRSAFEAEAYRVSMTLRYHLLGDAGDPGAYAEVLKSYGTTEADQAFVKEYLRLSLPTIHAKGVPDEAAKVTMDWLRQNAPEALVVT